MQLKDAHKQQNLKEQVANLDIKGEGKLTRDVNDCKLILMFKFNILEVFIRYEHIGLLSTSAC